jgi:hypothetical protein
LSSPREALTGLEGRAARSASRRASFSAFLAARAAFLAASASALALDLEPLDHSSDALRSSSSWTLARRDSFAAAFYAISCGECSHTFALPACFFVFSTNFLGMMMVSYDSERSSDEAFT